MASIISAGTTSGTALNLSGDTTGNLAFTTQAGANTITVPNVTGTLALTSQISSSNPVFNASLTGSNQTISAATFTKINCNSKSIDTNSCYDTSTYKFTPNVAGYYAVTANIDTSGNSNVFAVLYKNGSAYQRGTRFGLGNSELGCNAQWVVQCNGSTDYLELYFYAASGTTVYSGETMWSGYFVRSN